MLVKGEGVLFESTNVLFHTYSRPPKCYLGNRIQTLNKSPKLLSITQSILQTNTPILTETADDIGHLLTLYNFVLPYCLSTSHAESNWRCSP